MITPSDIHNQEFKRGFRGYDAEEVDDFLDRIVNDYETMFRENQQLKDEIELNKKKIEQYQELENNLQETLLVTKKTAEEVMQNAKLRAAEIRDAAIKECENMKLRAQMELSKQQASVQDDVRREEAKYDAVLQRQRQFLIKIKSLLRTELELLEEDGVRQAIGALDEMTDEEIQEEPQSEDNGQRPLPWQQ
ncbi:MAG: DivIVA domain-containing protein [Schwartzia sp.]|nr:DivIVA domain-containing protein [Schwartzia sp. (in: firmicutes)]